MKPRCLRCAKVIPTERAFAARSRGIEPRWCSGKCCQLAKSQRNRDRNRTTARTARTAGSKE